MLTQIWYNYTNIFMKGKKKEYNFQHISFSSHLRFMITYNSQKYNNFKEKILKILECNNINTLDSEAVISEKLLDTITLQVQECLISTDKFLKEKCPKCGKTHLKPFSSSYYRNVILKINNILIKVKLVVPRVICENCNSTHAVLPDFCVPLKQYSKDAIIEIATEAFATSTEETANTLNIESKQVRRFVNLVNSFVPNLSLLMHILQLKIDILENILNKLYSLLKQLPNITQIYFEHFKTIFLFSENKRYLYIEYAKLST